MKICVLIKQVASEDSSLILNNDKLTLNQASINFVSNEPDTYALEEALQIKEKFDVRYKNLISDVRKGVPEAANKKAALENLARELKISVFFEVDELVDKHIKLFDYLIRYF